MTHTMGTRVGVTSASTRVGANRIPGTKRFSLGSFDTVAEGFALDDGEVHSVRIQHESGALSVFLDSASAPVLKIPVDLSNLLRLDEGRAWVGFTGATAGKDWKNHDIPNWDYELLEDTVTTIHIDSVTCWEGNKDSTQLMFTVSRAGDTSGVTTAMWATSDGIATAGMDYESESRLLEFAPGQKQETIAVTIYGDLVEEQDETLNVDLSLIEGATATKSRGIATPYGLPNAAALQITNGQRITVQSENLKL